VSLQESALGRQQQDLARNAGLFGDQQRNQMEAIGFLPTLQGMGYKDAASLAAAGGQQQDLYQRAIDDDRAAFMEQRDWDKNNLGLLGNALGTIQGGTQTSSAPNPNYQSRGQQAAGYAALLASMWGGGK